MKMGNRRLKKLDSIGIKSQTKPRWTMDPKNRAEKRALERLVRKAKRISGDDGADDEGSEA